MEFHDVVRKRRMVRNFDERPVPPEILARILENATRAPSAGFSQGWAFLVLERPEDRARFWDASWPAADRGGPHAGVTRAPVVLIPYAHKQAYLDRYAEPDKGWTDKDEGRWPVPYWLVDTAFAAILALLTVVDEGLGAVFFGITEPRAVADSFGVPEAYTPIGALAIGYRAADTPSPSLTRGRRPLDEVVHRGRW